MKTTQLTGGKIPGFTRIDAACWLDGNDDEIIVEFWHAPGSILRTTYDRRSTRATCRFLNVHLEREAFDRMLQFVEGQTAQYCI
jgi:hypothetical protein